MCIAALKRKGKGSDVEEADMEAVVHAHNSELQKSSCPGLLTVMALMPVTPMLCQGLHLLLALAHLVLCGSIAASDTRAVLAWCSHASFINWSHLQQ